MGFILSRPVIHQFFGFFSIQKTVFKNFESDLPGCVGEVGLSFSGSSTPRWMSSSLVALIEIFLSKARRKVKLCHNIITKN